MYKLKKLPIIEFINNFKLGFNEFEIIKCFINGNCYHFSIILKNVYNDSRIVYDSTYDHFSVELNGKYYDITGEINKPIDMIYWDEMYYENMELYNSVLRDCVLKIQYYNGVYNEYCK